MENLKKALVIFTGILIFMSLVVPSMIVQSDIEDKSDSTEVINDTITN